MPVKRPLLATILSVTVMAGCLAPNAGNNDGQTTELEDDADSSNACGTLPSYVIDPAWPPTLPSGTVLGEIAGLATDRNDDVWILHRPGLTTSGGSGFGAGPPVLQLGGNGTYLQGWGGQGSGYDWPSTEHGITVDGHDHVWIGGNAAQSSIPTAPGADNMLLRFDKNGTFVLQIGGRGTNQGSQDTENVGRVADIVADENQVYVADGYGNKRVVVLTMTGDFVRHWGAFGNPPDDNVDDPDEQFGTPVHGIALSSDGTLYVADRENGRVHAFDRNGTFLTEIIPPNDAGEQQSIVFDAGFVGNEDEWLVIADGYLPSRGPGSSLGGSDRLVFICRATSEFAGQIRFSELPVGGPGLPGPFRQPTVIHAIATDASDSIYVGDLRGGGIGGTIHKLVRVGG